MLGELDLILTASLALIVVPRTAQHPDAHLWCSKGGGAALVSAAAGPSTLLAQAASAFSVVKYAEVVCLIYLGARTFLDRRGSAVPGGAAPVSLKSVFGQGVA
jgi:threonine/homoserine/homoserine lactone efflux protein